MKNKQLNLNIAGISIGIKAGRSEYLEKLKNHYEGFVSHTKKSDLNIVIHDKSVEKRAPTTSLVSLLKKNSSYTVVSKSLKY